MVFIHMPDEIVDGYLRLMSSVLTENGELYANVKLGTTGQGMAGFPVLSRPREFYMRLATSHGLTLHEVGALESLGHPPPPGGRGGATTMLRFSRAPL